VYSAYDILLLWPAPFWGANRWTNSHRDYLLSCRHFTRVFDFRRSSLAGRYEKQRDRVTWL